MAKKNTNNDKKPKEFNKYEKGGKLPEYGNTPKPPVKPKLNSSDKK